MTNVDNATKNQAPEIRDGDDVVATEPEADLGGWFESGWDDDTVDSVDAAKYAVEALRPGGTVCLLELYANDRVEPNPTQVRRLYYTASTTLCFALVRAT